MRVEKTKPAKNPMTSEAMLRQLEELKVKGVNHLPIIRAYAEKLRLAQIVNERVPSEMNIPPGVVILALVLDTLSGRTPLYRLDESFAGLDTEALLGQKIEAEELNDDLLGRVLDRTFRAGTLKIFSAVSRQAVQVFPVEGQRFHYDTTSVNVFGDYRYEPEAPPPFQIVAGYSKDHRPDLKQFLISLLCTGKRVPVFGKIEDGNASDKRLNPELLSQISERLKEAGIPEQAFIYIADSAMVSRESLREFGPEEYFITRLPATFNECERVIREAVEADQWTMVGPLAKTRPTKNRPVALYRVAGETVQLYGEDYQAVVVHSSAHDQRRRKRMVREQEAERRSLEESFSKQCLPEYACWKDAEKAAQQWARQKTFYYQPAYQVVAQDVYGRGRPPREGKRSAIRQVYRIETRLSLDLAQIQRRETEAGCFVLLAKLPPTGPLSLNARQILEAYKEQHGVEQNFSFLKDPAIVNAIFLKKEERIEVLGLVLLLSLLIWRLIEQDLDQFVEAQGKVLTGWDKKKTDRPTAFMLTTKFSGILLIRWGSFCRLEAPLNPVQREWLQALNLSPAIFLGSSRSP